MRIRRLNGYILIYLPEHPKAMKNDNWDGFVYEHVVIAEEMMGRSLREDEEVHHLDGDRSYNHAENLLVLEHSQHTKLHNYLQKTGATLEESNGMHGVNSGESKLVPYCPCGKILHSLQKKYCSKSCLDAAPKQRKVERPSKEQLSDDLQQMSWVAIGRKYGVSDNAIRKWAKTYGIDKATLSQAESTLSEGAETTGEVESS